MRRSRCGSKGNIQSRERTRNMNCGQDYLINIMTLERKQDCLEHRERDKTLDNHVEQAPNMTFILEATSLKRTTPTKLHRYRRRETGRTTNTTNVSWLEDGKPNQANYNPADQLPDSPLTRIQGPSSIISQSKFSCPSPGTNLSSIETFPGNVLPVPRAQRRARMTHHSEWTVRR